MRVVAERAVGGDVEIAAHDERRHREHRAAQAFADQRYLIALAVTVVWTAACLLGSMVRVEKRDRGVAQSQAV